MELNGFIPFKIGEVKTVKAILRWFLLTALLVAFPSKALAQLALLEPRNGSLISSPPKFLWESTDRTGAHLFFSLFYYQGPLHGGYIPHFLYMVAPTSDVVVQGNLYSGTPVIIDPFDVNDLDGTTNFITTISISDSLGGRHPVLLCFRKLDEHVTGNRWEWYAVVQEEDAASGFSYVATKGTLGFDTAGALVTQITSMNDFNFAGGVEQSQYVYFNFGTDTASGGDGLDGITQFAAASRVYRILTDDNTLDMPSALWNKVGPWVPSFWAVFAYDSSSKTWIPSGLRSFIKVK